MSAMVGAIVIMVGWTVLNEVKEGYAKCIEVYGNCTVRSDLYSDGFKAGYENATNDITSQIATSLNDYGSVVVALPAVTEDGSIMAVKVRLIIGG